MFPSPAPRFPRGASVQFSVNFEDFGGDVIQPSAGTVLISYPLPDGTFGTASVVLIGPALPATNWTGVWDSRGSGVGACPWFLYSDPGPPFGVAQGEFVLIANDANPVTFS